VIASPSTEPEAGHQQVDVQCTLEEDLTDAFAIIRNTRMALRVKKGNLKMYLKDL
jgi:hypothetical protein